MSFAFFTVNLTAPNTESKNFDAAIDYAFAHGMKGASDFVIQGGSAGGLSTFLHMDRVAARLKTEAPGCKVRGAPLVGFFLDRKPSSLADAHSILYIFR